VVEQLNAVYVDFQSRDCYRVWCWLSLLPEVDKVEVRPFSLDAATKGEPSPWERQATGSAGLELLALGELAREAGAATHHRFVHEAFRLVHEEVPDRSGLEAWLALGSRLGLDLDRFTADSERWRAEVGLWHAEGIDELGVSRVPSLVFGEHRALYVKLLHDVDDAEAAARLLADLADLAAHPVEEIRREA
jgi:hypothetical protein